VNPINDLPTARAGTHRNVLDAGGDGVETIILDGSGSTDVEGLVSYVWTEDGIPLATGVNPSVDLGVGTHTIELTVTDTDSATDMDEVTVSVSPGPIPGPLALTTPGAASQVVAGQEYPIRWNGGDAGTPVDIWSFGPAGLSLLAGDLPATDQLFAWQTAGAAVGRYSFAVRAEGTGQTSLSLSPAWLQVTEPVGQPTTADVLTWLSPAAGDAVTQGEAHEIRWELDVPTSGESAALWVHSAAGDQWTLVADGLDAHAGRYLWQTAEVAPGAYRFRLRLDDAGANEPDSDWLTVL
jgi:hypothetical protein